MIVIVDANVIISSLINKGVSFSVFLLNSILNKLEFIAPEFLLEEVKNHRMDILRFTELSEQDFEEVYDFLVGEITFIPASEFLKFLLEAKQLALHHKDAPYIALSPAFNCPILSGDKGLKRQTKIKVFSPSQVLSSIYELK